jgi:hypothetical protein
LFRRGVETAPQQHHINSVRQRWRRDRRALGKRKGIGTLAFCAPPGQDLHFGEIGIQTLEFAEVGIDIARDVGLVPRNGRI